MNLPRKMQSATFDATFIEYRDGAGDLASFRADLIFGMVNLGNGKIAMLASGSVLPTSHTYSELRELIHPHEREEEL